MNVFAYLVCASMCGCIAKCLRTLQAQCLAKCLRTLQAPCQDKCLRTLQAPSQDATSKDTSGSHARLQHQRATTLFWFLYIAVPLLVCLFCVCVDSVHLLQLWHANLSSAKGQGSCHARLLGQRVQLCLGFYIFFVGVWMGVGYILLY